jgi:eukaryotic-like serine/threonine-protein kinase
VTLAPGTKLGPYEIVAPLGAGGMGEVYRARDTRLDRTVAVKILPQALAATGESRERFEREARAISRLNHPHICHLYDVGHQNGTEYLVMEYLEGETLARRLERGALPVTEFLRSAIQIADALDKSHRQGIVHRDLKPGNIMLTKSGAKLLDFGLAKTAAPLSADLSSSPTVSRPLSAPTAGQALTTEGSIVGTFQYMSPEQLEGKEADARSDIFSFGAVLYEMATGKKAFEAQSQASLIAAILEHDPEPISTLRPLAPPSLDRVARTCLAKNPDDRFQSAHDLKLQLEWIRDAGSQSSASAAAPALPRRPARRTWIALLAGAVLLAILTAFVALRFFARSAPETAATRFTIPAPEKAAYELSLAISPNGRLLAFVALSGSQDFIWIRPLDSLEAHALNGTQGAEVPFWSPDSASIGFFAEGKLKRISLSTGAVQTLCIARDPRGGAWGPDGTILFTPDFRSPLYKIPANGGTPTQATEVDASQNNETSHRWPAFLPDGRHFLYFARTNGKQTQGVNVGSLDSRDHQRTLESDSGVAYASGFLLFVRGHALYAQSFDASALKLRGDAIPVAEGIEPIGEIGPTSYAPFSASANGVLIYRPEVHNLTQLTWFDRHGKQIGTVGPPGRYDELTMSRDGKRLALDVNTSASPSGDIWVVDLATSAFSRFTFDPASEISPVWSPDGSHIVFASNRSGEYNLYSKPSNGSSNEELLPGMASRSVEIPQSWSPDGKYLVYDHESATNDYDLWAVPMSGDTNGDRKPRPLIELPGAQNRAAVSPDSRWIAYESNETGEAEIWVQSFPPSGGKWQITTEGGMQPQWRRDGRELFYLAPNRKIMSVEVQLSPTFRATIPQTLFEAPISMKGIGDSNARYVFTPDGQRALVVADVSDSANSSPIHVVLNWPTALQKTQP